MPSVADFSPFRFNTDQQIAAGQLENFISHDEDRVFILKGHAGTGKTSLIDALIKYLKSRDIPVVLLASTGRAAKIVSQKASYPAETVHRHIYTLDVEKADDENKIRRLIFRLKENLNAEKTVFIVDECSMVSDHATSGIFIDFGSGRLLTDLFKYLGSRRVIFSGDPCQLPPVNTAFSPALNAAYLQKEHHKTVGTASLTQVMRHSTASGIHSVCTSLRQTIEARQFGYLNIRISGYPDMGKFPDTSSLMHDYALRVKKSGLDDCIVLCHTNAMAAELNLSARALLHPGCTAMVKGELLLVVQNNYKFNIANGEHLQVTEVGSQAEHRAGLSFRNIEGYTNDENGPRVVKGLVIDDLLYAREAALTPQQEYELFRDFAVRMKNRGIGPRHPAYLDEMLSDPYLNAIRAKFGYAVTCHKAQGGEWGHVYIVLERSLFNPAAKENQFRWAYTAISRGMQQVYLLDNICLK